MSSNIVWHESSITKEERRTQNKHQSFILWFTGLSASGKSSVANAFARRLFERGHQAFVLDGDNVRHGLNKDLGFDEAGRKENIRRIERYLSFCGKWTNCSNCFYFTLPRRPSSCP